MTDEKPTAKIPRTFWSKAYLREVEKGSYQLYRDMLVEGKGSDGQPVREKIGRPIPVGKVLREKQKGEEASVIVRSYDERTGRLLELVEV